MFAFSQSWNLILSSLFSKIFDAFSSLELKPGDFKIFNGSLSCLEFWVNGAAMQVEKALINYR